MGAMGEQPATAVQDIADQPGVLPEVSGGGRSDLGLEELLQPTKGEVRDEFFESNPVMLDMRARQAELGLPPDQVPPYVAGQRPNPLLVETLGNDYSTGEQVPLAPGDPRYQMYKDAQGAAKVKYSPDGYLKLGDLGGDQTQRAPAGPSMRGQNMVEKGYAQVEQGLKEKHSAQAAQMDTQAQNAALEQVNTDAANKEYMDKYNALQDEKNIVYRKAQDLQDAFQSNKIDPKHFWGTIDTDRKADLALAAFMQGFGGASDQMSFLKQAIDHDIQAQIANRKAQGDGAKSMLSLATKIFGDGKQALDITRAMALEQIKMKAKAKLAKSVSKTHKAGLKELIGKLKIEQGKYIDQAALARYKAKESSSNEDKVLARINQEFNWRVENVDDNITKMKTQITKYGLYEVTGPQNEIMDQMMYDIAIDYAKIVDPNSVAREGEVKAAQKYMLPIGKLYGLGMSVQTAHDILDNYRALIKNKIKNRAAAYKTYKTVPQNVYEQGFTPSK